MSKVMLNSKMVESIKPPQEGVAEYFDERVTGLILRVYASGTRTWTMRTKVAGEKKRVSLGDAKILPLAEARERAIEILLAQMRGQVIPYGKPAELIAFEQMGREYIDRYSKPNKKSWKEDLRMLEKDVLPTFAHRPINEITRREIITFLDKLLGQGYTIKVNRTHGLIREILNYAVDCEYLRSSPAAGIKKRHKEISRDRVLSDDEMKKVWRAFHLLRSPTREFFKFYAMTGQRGTETKNILRRNINLEKRTLELSKETTKNGRAHVIPITPEMNALIENCMETFRESKWLFPSPRLFRRDKMMGDFCLRSMQKAIDRIRRLSGVDFNGHDFRRTMATWLSSNGVPRMTVSKLLNHSDRSITSVYDRYSYDREKREALEMWTRFLDQLS